MSTRQKIATVTYENEGQYNKHGPYQESHLLYTARSLMHFMVEKCNHTREYDDKAQLQPNARSVYFHANAEQICAVVSGEQDTTANLNDEAYNIEPDEEHGELCGPDTQYLLFRQAEVDHSGACHIGKGIDPWNYKHVSFCRDQTYTKGPEGVKVGPKWRILLAAGRVRQEYE